jgi:hypothetical protein
MKTPGDAAWPPKNYPVELMDIDRQSPTQFKKTNRVSNGRVVMRITSLRISRRQRT